MGCGASGAAKAAASKPQERQSRESGVGEKAVKFGNIGGNAVAEIIVNCAFISNLTAEDVDGVCVIMTGRIFQASEIVFSQGVIGQEFYTIFEGNAQRW